MESWNQDLYSRNHCASKKVWRKYIRCCLPPLETLHRQCWRWCLGQSLCLKSRQKLQRNAKNDEKKSNQRTLNKRIQNRIIKFELEEEKKSKVKITLFIVTFCDNFCLQFYTLRYLLRGFIFKSKKRGWQQVTAHA